MSNAPDDVSWREGRSPLRAIGLFLALYFVLRIGSLSSLPIFLDEAVHLQWAERLWSEGRILRPVGSGRLLAVAAYGLALPFDDRLWAARLIASLAGAMTLVFTMLLARRLFGARATVVAGALYVSSPFALVYDRLALSDGFLSANIAGLMLALLALIDRPDAPWPRLLTATFIALAIVSKVSALLFFLTIPVGIVALARVSNRERVIRAAVIAGAMGLACASPMLWFFARNSGEISSQHLVDTTAVASTIAVTLSDMSAWLRSYFTWPALLVATVSVAVLRDGRAFWLVASGVLPFLLFALLGQPWSARYVLPTLPPFLVLLSGGVDALAARTKGAKSDWAAAGLVALTIFSSVSFDRDLVLDPSRAPFPEDDRRQLVTGWPSGYGVRELAVRLEQEARTGEITTYLDAGGTRTFPTSLAVLVGRHPSIRLVEGDFATDALRASMAEDAKTRRVFAVWGPRPPGIDFKSSIDGVEVERVELYQRPGGEWAATLFRLRRVAGTAPGAADQGLF